MNNDPIKKPKPKSTQAEKDARVQKVLQMLREGADRVVICENMRKYADIKVSATDRYIAEARRLLEAEQAKIDEAVQAERRSRALEASKKIPTNEELIAILCRKIDLASPEVTGYELKVINGEVSNVQRFASEDFFMKAIIKIIEYNKELNKADVIANDEKPNTTNITIVNNTSIVEKLSTDDLLKLVQQYGNTTTPQPSQRRNFEATPE